MENFEIAKALGFLLAGILIAIFSDRRALFWGATLVVSAFIGYNNPVWGVVTFVELAIGWMIGRWLLTNGRGLSYAVGKRQAGLTSLPRPPSPAPSPPQPPSQETLQLVRPVQAPNPESKTARKASSPRPALFYVLAGVVLAVMLLFALALVVEHYKSRSTDDQILGLETATYISPQSFPSQDSAAVPTALERPGREAALIERLAAFLMDERRVFLALELASGEILAGTMPAKGNPAIHRLFVIDCRTGSYSRNAESLEAGYILEVGKKLSDGEPFTLDPIASGLGDPEASELFRLACGAA